MSEQEETENSSETTPTETTTTPTTTEQQQEENRSLLTEEKPAEEKKEPEAPLEPLTADDISLPEGFEVADDLRDEFLGAFNNQELGPKERAQALIDLQVKAMEKASEASSQAWADTVKDWKAQIKADPEIGGEKLQPNLDKIGRLVNEYGDDATLQAFELTGAGANPAIIKFLAKVAANMTEGGPVSGAPATSPADRAARMFPSMKG